MENNYSVIQIISNYHENKTHFVTIAKIACVLLNEHAISGSHLCCLLTQASSH